MPRPEWDSGGPDEGIPKRSFGNSGKPTVVAPPTRQGRAAGDEEGDRLRAAWASTNTTKPKGTAWTTSWNRAKVYSCCRAREKVGQVAVGFPLHGLAFPGVLGFRKVLGRLGAVERDGRPRKRQRG